ncbi:uncharacterized protein LOC121916511 [Sceloporus undulatus]|uniref:uncharacterized protein LOC121916511 n=1 Tax=Sceloporus undulatus TaxID=8520 RepID=UPI001C4D63D9|nr:uncharacterized protein LOC121916511 [Sceloporus undulatus]
MVSLQIHNGWRAVSLCLSFSTNPQWLECSVSFLLSLCKSTMARVLSVCLSVFLSLQITMAAVLCVYVLLQIHNGCSAVCLSLSLLSLQIHNGWSVVCLSLSANPQWLERCVCLPINLPIAICCYAQVWRHLGTILKLTWKDRIEPNHWGTFCLVPFGDRQQLEDTRWTLVLLPRVFPFRQGALAKQAQRNPRWRLPFPTRTSALSVSAFPGDTPAKCIAARARPLLQGVTAQITSIWPLEREKEARFGEGENSLLSPVYSARGFEKQRRGKTTTTHSVGFLMAAVFLCWVAVVVCVCVCLFGGDLGVFCEGSKGYLLFLSPCFLEGVFWGESKQAVCVEGGSRAGKDGGHFMQARSFFLLLAGGRRRQECKRRREPGKAPASACWLALWGGGEGRERPGEGKQPGS